MKILSAQQIKAVDLATIESELVSSVELMERAAFQCANHIKKLSEPFHSILFVCGQGNNGGDGLAIARILFEYFSSQLISKQISVFVVGKLQKSSPDFLVNLERIRLCTEISITETNEDNFHDFLHAIQSCSTSALFVDCIFGTGLNKAVTGLHADVIKALNKFARSIVSVDLPSGLFADQSTLSTHDAVIHSSLTLTFQYPKLGLLMAENYLFCDNFLVLDIGLHSASIEVQQSPFYFLERKEIQFLLRGRKKFSHKGTYGHALLACGSYGMSGAAVLSVHACTRSGVGLVTAHLPTALVNILQQSVPEAIVYPDTDEKKLTYCRDFINYSSLGIGPGIGTDGDTAAYLKNIIQHYSGRLLLDADALNILSDNKTWLAFLRPQTIITPHPKEFDRLFGSHTSDFDRLETARENAIKFSLVIVLKGAHTAVVTSTGKVYFNSTGNAGMSKGGSGDVLTGLITGLLARGYEPIESCLLGVYLHGLAGDLARDEYGMEAMKASDIIRKIPNAFQQLYY
jgi:ADP-dependent NAD(P)H-hydrate dehydratase / NAD(P)H-hydrate epimerase